VVPFVDLPTEHWEIREALDEAVRRVLDSSRFVLDEEVRAFEEEFATYCGVEHCVGVASGTDAVVLALRACFVGPGDEGVVPAFGFVATAFAVLRSGRSRFSSTWRTTRRSSTSTESPPHSASGRAP
jgi:dTDP-4-amino-4,6-dideoxygalactose transaminase